MRYTLTTSPHLRASVVLDVSVLLHGLVTPSLETLSSGWTREIPHCSALVLSSTKSTRSRSRLASLFLMCCPAWGKYDKMSLWPADFSLGLRPNQPISTETLILNTTNSFVVMSIWCLYLCHLNQAWRNRRPTFRACAYVALCCLLGHDGLDSRTFRLVTRLVSTLHLNWFASEIPFGLEVDIHFDLAPQSFFAPNAETRYLPFGSYWKRAAYSVPYDRSLSRLGRYVRFSASDSLIQCFPPEGHDS